MSKNTWKLGEDGMIAQTLTDMQDSNTLLFTATARDHNQAIADSKEKA